MLLPGCAGCYFIGSARMPMTPLLHSPGNVALDAQQNNGGKRQWVVGGFLVFINGLHAFFHVGK